MPYYRIRIDELKNGETRYVPQEGFLVEYNGWIKRTDIRWDDMHKDGFDLEEDALEMINYEKITFYPPTSKHIICSVETNRWVSN
jgi:hypothetical protein